MLCRLIDHPFIDLIGQTKDVVLLAQIGDQLQFFISEHFTQRIVGGVQDDHLRTIAEEGFQFILV